MVEQDAGAWVRRGKARGLEYCAIRRFQIDGMRRCRRRLLCVRRVGRNDQEEYGQGRPVSLSLHVFVSLIESQATAADAIHSDLSRLAGGKIGRAAWRER